jgi:hypothetical protein
VTDQPPPAAAVDPRFAAVFEQARPYAAVTGAVALLGTPAEVLVPVVRRLRGRSGVSLGPGLVNLLNGLLGLGLVHLSRTRPARWARVTDRPPPPWVALVLAGYAALSPATGARWQRGVVLPGRSALWGGLISPLGLLQIAVVLTTLRRALRARREA